MKKILPAMKIAFRALRINKLRSALTMLGIIIGVGAVIAMVAVGSGATERIQQQIASIGSTEAMWNIGNGDQNRSSCVSRYRCRPRAMELRT